MNTTQRFTLSTAFRIKCGFYSLVFFVLFVTTLKPPQFIWPESPLVWFYFAISLIAALYYFSQFANPHSHGVTMDKTGVSSGRIKFNWSEIDAIEQKGLQQQLILHSQHHKNQLLIDRQLQQFDALQTRLGDGLASAVELSHFPIEHRALTLHIDGFSHPNAHGEFHILYSQIATLHLASFEQPRKNSSRKGLPFTRLEILTHDGKQHTIEPQHHPFECYAWLQAAIKRVSDTPSNSKEQTS